MKISEFNEKKFYSDGSGVAPLLDLNIKMELNKYGFYEEVINPDIQINDLDDSLREVLPFLNDKLTVDDVAKNLFDDIKGIKYDKRLGYFDKLYVGHVNESNYRQNASSGGMGTWILAELMEQNLVDAIIHVKENVDEVRGEILFKYDISKNVDELKKGAKTRYFPVEMSEVLKYVSENPGRYAIIGIPSFIMAVRLLQKNNSIFKERIKYTVGLVCGHQKSSKFLEYMSYQVGIDPKNIKSFDFRKKLENKPANKYAIEISAVQDGKQINIIEPKDNLLGQNWGHGFFKSVASDYIDDVFNETADVTIGDAWLPNIQSDPLGNNIVIVRNKDISELINKGNLNSLLKLNEVDSNTIYSSQSSHYKHTHDELSYRLYKIEREKKWHPISRVQPNKKIGFIRSKIQDLRQEIAESSNTKFVGVKNFEDITLYNQELEVLINKYSVLYKVLNFKNRVKSFLSK